MLGHIAVNYFQIRIIHKLNNKVGLDIFPLDYCYKKINEDEKLEFSKKIKQARKIFEEKHNLKQFPNDDIYNAKRDLAKITKRYIMDDNEPIKQTSVFYAIDYPYRPKKYLVLDYNTIFPLKKIEFEGKKYNCPNNYKEYLDNLYGEYMKFPSI